MTNEGSQWRFPNLGYREIVRLLSVSARQWNEDNAPRLGAALAFYTLLSIAPLLIVVVGIAALALGPRAAGGQLVWEMQELTGRAGAKAIEAVVAGAFHPGAGVIAACLSILAVLFGASSLVVELRDDLNLIWRVPVPAVSGFTAIRHLIKERFYSFAAVLGIGFLLLFSVVLSAWIAALGRFRSARLPFPEVILHLTSFAGSFVVITFLFAVIYKTLPDVKLKWSDVAVGASATSLIFSFGKQLIGVYLGKASFSSTYGAAGSIVILLVWVYYSAQLFFFGAEFTKAYAERFGSRGAAAS